MPLQDLTNQQVESMVQTSGASTTATARHCGRTRNNGQEGTPSPPSGTIARKHSPWTNPRQRKKGRARGTLPHRPTIDERGEIGALQLDRSEGGLAVIEQLQSVTLASPNAAVAATPAPGSSKQRQHRSSRDAPAIDVTDISPPKKVKLDGESSPGEQEPQQADPPEMQQRLASCTLYPDPASHVTGRASSMDVCATSSAMVRVQSCPAPMPGPAGVPTLFQGFGSHRIDTGQGPFAGYSEWGNGNAEGRQVGGEADEDVKRRLEMEGLDGAREEEGFVLRTARIVIETSSSHSSSIGDRGTGCTADGVTSSLRASGAEVATYTSHLNAAARRGDWDEAETLWLELLDEGLQPDVHTLNALLRCVMRAGVYDVDAEALVRDVCGDGTVHPNCFTHQLLSSIMLQGEQLVRGG